MTGLRRGRILVATAFPIAGAFLAVAAPAPAAPPGPAGATPAPRSLRDDAVPPPIAFRELSTLSGGTIDFGTPTSDVEKATCAFVDTDGDGWDDLVSLTGVDQPFLYFLNRPDGSGGRTFVPAPPNNGLDTGTCRARDGAAIAAGDVDGDGDPDLFVGCGWNTTIEAGRGRNILLLNDGAGGFQDVTAQVGITDKDDTTCAVLLFDMDLDGDLDLFVCNSHFDALGKVGDGAAHLWRNEMAETGTLRFVDETAERGIVERGFGVWCVTGVDYDGDGVGDLLLGHDGPTETQLFRNDGAGHFTEVTYDVGSGEGDDTIPSTFGDDSYSAMGFAWGDVENDGDLDLYVTNTLMNPLYRNNGDGTFTEVGERSGVRADEVTWGCDFADFDLDGFVDLYCAGGDFWDLARPQIRSFLFHNHGDGTFDDVLATAGMRRDYPLHREQGTAVADFDRDGRPDVLVARAERGGASPYLYRNETGTGGRRWLAVRLRGNGRTSNTSAVGARVRVVPLDADGAAIPGLSQLREVNGGDSRSSQSSFVQTVGLGPDAVSADVTVTWPRAGTLAERTEVYRDVPVDRLVTLTEDARQPTWRPDAVAEATVPDGRVTAVRCPGDAEPDPLTTLSVETGPSWVTAGGWDAGRTVVVDAPRVAAPADTVVGLLADAQGASSPEARQTLTLHVVPAPRVDAVKRSGRTLVLRGDHLEIRGLAAEVDGVACKAGRGRVVRPRRKPSYSQVRVTVPRSLAKAIRKGAHAVTLTDPSTGLATTRGF